MNDPITAEVEALFDGIDSVELRAKLRRRSRRLKPQRIVCTFCDGTTFCDDTGEAIVSSGNGWIDYRACNYCGGEGVIL